MVRRGPLLEGSLIGLITRARAAQVRRLAREHGVRAHEVRPGCPWQPTILRIRATEAVVNAISVAGELAPLEWLTWSHGDDVPEHLDVDAGHQDLWTDNPPAGLSLAKSWDWEAAEFRRGAPPDGTGVQVEQRAHRDSCSVYVILVDGSPRLWTHVRNWALLHAHLLKGASPVRAASVRVDHYVWGLASPPPNPPRTVVCSTRRGACLDQRWMQEGGTSRDIATPSVAG